MNYIYFYTKFINIKNYIVAFGYYLYSIIFTKKQNNDDLLKEFTDIDVDYEKDILSIINIQKGPEEPQQAEKQVQEVQKESGSDSESESESENLSYEIVDHED